MENSGPQSNVKNDPDQVQVGAQQTQQGQAMPGSAPSVRSRHLMSRDTAALLVIDVQEKLVPHIRQNHSVIWNIGRLIDAAQVLNVSTLCTEQYPAGLGGTVPLIAERIKSDDEKSLFSCRDCANVIERLRKENRHQVLLCGIESHVCVQQTALDLIGMGFDVWVAVDAIGSRFELDHVTAIRRMEAAGVTVTTTESAMFEWCEVSGTHEFKRISTLVRELPPESVVNPDARYFPRLASRYLIQSAHSESNTDGKQTKVKLSFIVRSTNNGQVVQEFNGTLVRETEDASKIISKSGVQGVEVTADGTAVSVQDADGNISMIYLPIGDARTNHPRWKVRKTERHIASEEYKHDYQILFKVVDYKTDTTFREFVGYEHRDPQNGGFTHVSGVRQVEVSSDGKWIIVTEMGRSPDLIEMPAE